MKISFRKTSDLKNMFEEEKYDEERRAQDQVWYKKQKLGSDGGFILIEDFFWDNPELQFFDGLVAIDGEWDGGEYSWTIDHDDSEIRWTNINEEGPFGKSRPATPEEREKVLDALEDSNDFRKNVDDEFESVLHGRW